MLKSHLSLASKITQNRLAMAGLARPSLFRLDVAVTYLCDSACSYCKIWEMYRKNPELFRKELSFQDYEKLFESLDISWLHITGGEPFLKKELAEIIKLADKKINPILIDTSTNGFMTGNILRKVEEILNNTSCKFIVGVSLDGPEIVNNESRGIKDAWKKTLNTYLKLKELKNKFKKFDVHINHFISPMNILYIDEFLDNLKEFEIDINEISIEVARNSVFFQNDEIKIDFDKELLIKKLREIYDNYRDSEITLRNVLRGTYIKEMINFVKGQKTIRCASGYSSLYLDPYGFVFPCSLMKTPMGNIKEQNIDDILISKKMDFWREKFKNCQICWSGCEGITSIIQNLPFSIY